MKTFLIVLIVIIVLFRVFSSFIFKRINKTVNERMKEHIRNQQPPKPEGEITIEQTKNIKNKSGKNDDGDYVDYEEVK